MMHMNHTLLVTSVIDTYNEKKIPNSLIDLFVQMRCSTSNYIFWWLRVFYKWAKYKSTYCEPEIFSKYMDGTRILFSPEENNTGSS